MLAESNATVLAVATGSWAGVYCYDNEDTRRFVASAVLQCYIHLEIRITSANNALPFCYALGSGSGSFCKCGASHSRVLVWIQYRHVQTHCWNPIMLLQSCCLPSCCIAASTTHSLLPQLLHNQLHV